MAKHIPYLKLTMIHILLTGCTVGPDFIQPAPPFEARYNDIPLPLNTHSTKGIGGGSQAFIFNQAIPEKWWTLFHSEKLNELIVQGFKNNPNIEEAKAALKAAQANLQSERGRLWFPSVDLQGFTTKQKINGSTFGEPLGPTTYTLFNTQINVAYDLDLFGGGRRQVEAAAALRDYQNYELEATYLSLAANIATTAITEAQYRAQIEATQQIIRLAENLLKITKGQFELGGASRSDVLSQESQLSETRATLPPLEKNLAKTRHALAALLGELPSENKLPTFNLQELHLPGQLPVSLPSALINARPDIKAKTALLHQASAKIGIATANFLPQFSLAANNGWQAATLGDFFSPANHIWSLTAQVLQPVFRGGSLIAQRESAVANYEMAKANYKQSVIFAFQNVADALRAIEFDATLLKSQTEALDSANNLLNITKNQFEVGAVNYLSLLNAQQQYQEILINQISATALRYLDTVALFQSLGGGWWHTGVDNL